MFDMMMKMQEIGLRSMSLYQPAAAAFWTATKPRQTGQNTAYRPFQSPSRTASGTVAVESEQVVSLGEEVLTVGTRMVPGKTTRVRRVVVESPVQQEVTLRTETVIVEHRRPLSAAGQDVLTEVTYEMSDFNEVPVVTKSVHVTEEVVLRKEVTARLETIHDTVKRDKLEIEDQTNLPVVFNAAAAQEEKRQAAAAAEKKPLVPAVSTAAKLNEAKPGEQKRQAL
jgi:stress response protein YsnF